MEDSNQNVDVEAEKVEQYMCRLPRSYAYKGYIWPGLCISPERLDQLYNMKFRPNDILIVTYPKSGTTWVSEIVSSIVHRGDVAFEEKLLHERVPWLELEENIWVRFFWIWQVFSKLIGWYPQQAAITSQDEKDDSSETETPRIWFTHLPLEMMPKAAVNGGCRIIYVARNPKDTAVSYFHFHKMSRFLGQQPTDWNEFFPLYAMGKLYCGSWFDHVRSFYQLSKSHPRMLFVKYEDLKKDLRSGVGQIGDFLGVDLADETASAIVDHCQFTSMKDNKMVNRQGIWLFNQRVSLFMRKGEVGDWQNYFTIAQDKIFTSLYQQKMADMSDLQFEFELD